MLIHICYISICYIKLMNNYKRMHCTWNLLFPQICFPSWEYQPYSILLVILDAQDFSWKSGSRELQIFFCSLLLFLWQGSWLYYSGNTYMYYALLMTTYISRLSPPIDDRHLRPHPQMSSSSSKNIFALSADISPFGKHFHLPQQTSPSSEDIFVFLKRHLCPVR